MAMEIWFPVWRFYLQIRNDRSFAAVVLSLNHRSGRVSQWECKPFANAGIDRRQLVLPAHCLNKTVTQRKWLPQIKCYPKSGRQSRGRRH